MLSPVRCLISPICSAFGVSPTILRRSLPFSIRRVHKAAFDSHIPQDSDDGTRKSSRSSSQNYPNPTPKDRRKSSGSSRAHTPVLRAEVLDALWRLDNLADSDLVFLDMTFGAGGHSEAILETFPQCRIIALDRDPACGFYMRQLEDVYPGQLIPLCGRFSELPSLLKKINWKAPIDAILLDAGCSSMQMDQGNRGFAISAPEATLDMRMDGPEKPELISAADIVNRMSEENLTTIFKKYGDEKMAARISRGIIESRFMMKKIVTTGDLATIIASVMGGDRTDRMGRRQHPATKVFQALRIFVNDELNELDFAMSVGHKLLKPNGLFAAITFHSLECQIVKEHFHSADWKNKLRYDPANPQLARSYRTHARWLPKDDLLDTMQFRWKMLTKKAIQASDKEVEENPRSRSAKLRAAFKID